MEFIFWTTLIITFYTYVGYPLILVIISGFVKEEQIEDPVEWPNVSIILSSYNEENNLKKKIDNLLALDYPKEKVNILIGSDGSTDRTNNILKECQGFNITYLVSKERQGKPRIITQLVSKAKGEILFFVDTRQQIEKDALKNIVRNFNDSNVGCVSGELVLKKERASSMSKGVDISWKDEQCIRSCESKLYSMIGATGAIYAVRRELFVSPSENILLDDVFIPLKVVERGHRAIFEGSAHAYDEAAETSREEFTRKVRTIAGNFQLFFLCKNMLNPFKSKIAIQFISHKLLRAISFVFLGILYFSNSTLLYSTQYKIIFIDCNIRLLSFNVVFIFYFFALIGWVAEKNNIQVKAVSVPYAFCVLNFASLKGFMNFVGGKAAVQWEKARQTEDKRL